MKISNYLLIFSLCFVSCTTVEDNAIYNTENLTSEWCVPTDLVTGGSLIFELDSTPNYKSIAEIDQINFLNDSSKVALLKLNNTIYAYPYDYTNYYEVVNDQSDGLLYAITYCPITESAICFNRTLNDNTIINLKASGYLYKENMVPMSNNGDFFWSQFLNEGIQNNSKEVNLKTINIIETTWVSTKKYFNEAFVYNHPNISNCECNETFTKIDYTNRFGVLNKFVNSTVVNLFDYNDFKDNITIKYITINGKNTIVVGNKELAYFNAFFVPHNTTFEPLNIDQFPNILVDDMGITWDAFGYATNASTIKEKLGSPPSFVGADWAWESFYNNLVLHN